MANKAHALFLAPVALFLATGSSQCDAFSTVVVPASDATPPDTYDGVWFDGEYEELLNQDTAFTYHLPAGKEVIAVASGVDMGGVKKISMSREWSWRCCSLLSPSICSNTSSLAAALTDTQAGGVGSSVSNGMWLGQAVELPNISTLCNAGWYATSWRFRWTTTAENYHGVKRTGPTRTIQWP